MAVPALAGIVAIELLGTKLYGNITLLQIISVVSLYFIWKAFNRDL